jgi:hypothetical protein
MAGLNTSVYLFQTASLMRMRRTTVAAYVSILLIVGGEVLATEQNAFPVDFQVSPSSVNLVGMLDRVQLVVSRQTLVGRDIDLTRTATYESLSPRIVDVSVRGRVIPLSLGDGIIRVTVDEKTADVPVTIRPADAQSPVSFTEQVLPVLSKAGCNQGACHGGQFGQGNFKLSLLGFAPEQDFESIVRDSRQRRVSFAAPAESLLLKKALSTTPHGGGKRLDTASAEFQTLKAWIETGAAAPMDDEPRLTSITVVPAEREYRQHESQQLRVIAEYSDGSHRDVTHNARYDSLGKGIATVTSNGYVTVDGQGQAAIMVRYRGRARISSVIHPYADDIDLSEFQPLNYIDEHVSAKWKMIGLTPSTVCSDEEFIRRAFLASIGTLPSVDIVERFLASEEADKRTVLVDELLGLTGDPKRDAYIEEWSAYWTQKWGDLLRNNREKVGETGMWAFANWMRNSFRENKPMDQFVREILLAQGSIYQNGQANFYKVADKPTDLAETTAQVFMGVRLQCAQCHQHPFESFSQTDYYGFAAFFTRVTTKRSSDFGAFGFDTVVRLKSSGNIKHPRSGVAVPPTPLGQEPLTEVSTRDLRRPLADWLTSPQNKLFARNIANRTWGYLMGAAIVEPIDDLRETNPPSNPKLLNALAADFVETGYDLRQLMRSIMTSRVFQLSSTATDENGADTKFSSHYVARRLPAEVLLDAIDVVCGTQEQFTGVPLGTRAIELPDPNFDSYFLDTLGRPQRIVSCECERTAEPNLAQVLQLANGELIQRKLSDKAGRITQLMERTTDDDAVFTELYLTALSRYPTQQELGYCQQILNDAGDRRSGLEDVVWALINGREFLFNH